MSKLIELHEINSLALFEKTRAVPPFGGVGGGPPPPLAGYAVAIALMGASPVGTLMLARPPETVIVGPVHPPSVGSP